MKPAIHSQRRKPAAFCSSGPPAASPAAHKTMVSRTAGKTRFLPKLTSRPAKASVALEAVAEEIGLPEAAIAATKDGISVLSSASICSRAWPQAEKRLPAPERASAVTAQIPAIFSASAGRLRPEASTNPWPKLIKAHTAKMVSEDRQESCK